MTVLTGTFVDVAETKAVGSVTVSVERSRSAYSGSGFIVTTQRHRVPLVDGAFTTPDLDPGPVLVEAEAPGFFESFRVNLPLDGEHDLHDLLEAQAEYDPPVVGRAEAAARRARESAEDAEGHANDAAEQREHIDQVVADGAAAVRQHVEDEATRAETAATASEESADRSETARKDAETARDEAGDARTDAETARDEAEIARTGAQAAAAQAALEKISEIVGDAPEALDTIYELAEAVANNQTGIGAIEAALNNRVVGAFRVVVQDTPPAAGTPSNQLTFVRGN